MSDFAEEAVYAALLYINQRTPRPRAARALMDALRQDGYEVRPIVPTPPDAALREAAEEWRDALDAYAVRPWGRGEQYRYADARDALRAALEAKR